MLTQQLMKLVFIQRYEVSYNGDVEDEIISCIEAINTTQILLMNYEPKTEPVRQAIDQAQAAWMEFIQLFRTEDIDLVVELNGTVLIEMDKLVNELVKQHSPETVTNEDSLSNISHSTQESFNKFTKKAAV